MVATACAPAHAGTAAAFAGRWTNASGTCSIRVLDIAADASGQVTVAWSGPGGTGTTIARLGPAAGDRPTELAFAWQPGVEARLWLNAGRELRLYRVFAAEAPPEDIDFCFYR